MHVETQAQEQMVWKMLLLSCNLMGNCHFIGIICYLSFTEALVKSLRKLILGSEEYRSRPCVNLDVCSEHQVQLVLEVD